jgi:hypothetical protein
MKTRILAATSFLAGALLAQPVLAATHAEQVESYKKMLSKAPKLEMPAKAAAEVKNAKQKNKKETTLAVLEAALFISPASAPTIVRALSRVAPEFNQDIVAAAGFAVPQMRMEIQSAAVIAPAMAEVQPAGSTGFGGRLKIKPPPPPIVPPPPSLKRIGGLPVTFPQNYAR